MGSFTGAASRAAQAAQLELLKRENERQRGYWDQRSRTFIHRFLPVEDERGVSAVYTQTDTKCRCCGSQEVVHHNKRTICAYCRSSMQ